MPQKYTKSVKSDKILAIIFGFLAKKQYLCSRFHEMGAWNSIY